MLVFAYYRLCLGVSNGVAHLLYSAIGYKVAIVGAVLVIAALGVILFRAVIKVPPKV